MTRKSRKQGGEHRTAGVGLRAAQRGLLAENTFLHRITNTFNIKLDGKLRCYRKGTVKMWISKENVLLNNNKIVIRVVVAMSIL